MGKVTVHKIGQIKVKMDTPDDVYYDAKDPHVSFERDGSVILNHFYLATANDYVGRDSDEKKAIYWVRKYQEDLEDMYKKGNPKYLYKE